MKNRTNEKYLKVQALLAQEVGYEMLQFSVRKENKNKNISIYYFPF